MFLFYFSDVAKEWLLFYPSFIESWITLSAVGIYLEGAILNYRLASLPFQHSNYWKPSI